jgi:hypothetical protein
MSESIYTRQEPLNIVRDQTVVVVGCGGVGAWVGYFLGMAGVQELELFDSDTISGHNLNRLPFTPAHIGQSKSAALAALIASTRPDAIVRAHGDLDADYHMDVIKSSDAVVVSTDSFKSRKMTYDMVVKGNGAYRRTRYYELGADGMSMSVTGEPAGWSTELENEPGYASVPVWVGPCVLAAAAACYYILRGMPLTDTFRADWDDSTGLKIGQYVGV